MKTMGVPYGPKRACTMCNSSDAYQVYQEENGSFNATCFSCNEYDPDPFKSLTKQKAYGNRHTYVSRRSRSTTKLNMLKPEDILSLPIRELKDRKLDEETCRAFGIHVSLSQIDGQTITSHYYPVYKQSKLTGFKERVVADKKFFTHGDCKEPDLFGQNRSSSGKTLYITEGELDCLSVWQTLRKNSTIKDWDPSVVSISRGAATAKSDILNNYQYVNSFEKVVIIFDNDEAGRSAAVSVAKTLPGKSFFVSLPDKDPSSMLQMGNEKELYWAIQTSAKRYKPDGIINGKDTWDRFKNRANQHCYEYPPTWVDLNEKTKGVRPGSIVTITSGTGSGKTTLLEELKYHFYNTTDERIADISLEQDVGDTVGNQISLHLNKRVMHPDVKTTEEELQQAHSFLYDSGRWDFYDHFGGMDDDTLFDQITFFAASGHKFIFLDHLSIVISEYADKGGERERIDAIMTKLAKIVKAYDAVIFLVVHLKKTEGSGKSFENGREPTLDDLRGSGSIKQLSWDVLSISRNQQHEDEYVANTSKLVVLKCRFTGGTGCAGYLHYNKTTGRMHYVDMPVNYQDNPMSNVTRIKKVDQF